MDPHDLLDRLEPGHPRELEIHRHEVWTEPRKSRDRLLRGREDADDLDLAVVLEGAAQRLRVRARVLADEDLSPPPDGAQVPTSCSIVSSSAC